MNATITILCPVPERVAGAATRALAWDLPDPVRVGTLSNSKPNTSHLLDGALGVLAADARVVVTARERKESASRPADTAVLNRLAADCDLVLDATAD